MATRQHICHRYKKIKSVLGPIWFADLMALFGVGGVEALKVKIDALRPADSGALGNDNRRYHKNARGESLPNDEEIALLRRCHPSADRVPKLALWQVICEDAAPSFEFTRCVWAKLSHRVRRYILDPIGGHYRMPPNYPPADFLAPLAYWCDPDAVGVLMYFLHMRYPEKGHFLDDTENSTQKLIPYVEEALIRLLVFEPFRKRKRELFERVSERYFTLRCENYDELRDEDVYETVYQGLSVEIANGAMDEVLEFLESFGRLGLIGNGFEEQVAFVNWYYDFDLRPESWRKKAVKDSMRHYCHVNDTGYIRPNTPMYRVLMKLGHRGAQSGQRIAIPRRHERNMAFRVANAIDGTRPTGERLRCKPDHRRSGDTRDRSDRSDDPDEAVNPDQCMHLRKPATLTTETGKR